MNNEIIKFKLTFISKIIDILYHIFISFISIFVTNYISFIIIMFITEDRYAGMSYGWVGGIVFGILILYKFTKKFNYYLTFFQYIINFLLSIIMYILLHQLLKDTEIAKINYGFVLYYISAPIIITLNKLTLDFITKKKINKINIKFKKKH